MAAISALVLDDVEAPLPELRDVVQHAFHHLGGVALPVPQLGGSGRTAVRSRVAKVLFDDSIFWMTGTS